MYRCEVQEAKALVFKIGEMLDQVEHLAGEEADVARTLGATRYQLEELDAALWYVEPQARGAPQGRRAAVPRAEDQDQR